MVKKSTAKKLAFTTANWDKLLEPEKELHVAVDFSILKNQKRIADEQKQENETLRRIVINPGCGVRKERSEKEVVLKAVNKPIVTASFNELTIEWVETTLLAAFQNTKWSTIAPIN